ncbi:hypothetical protein MTO96_028715 [Rhipicephalus appendiculatus]
MLSSALLPLCLMTSADLDRLCFHLSVMEANQLYSLEDEPSLTIPPIRGLPLPRAVASIRRHVGAINPTLSRVHYMCEIYACLMKKGVLGPWGLYQVDDTQRVPEAADVVRYIKETDLNYFSAHSENVTTECTHICALVLEVELETNRPSRCLEIYCFCIWPSLACVAALKPTDGYSAGQNEVLEKMFGNDAEDFECGKYEDLDLAHQAATNFASTKDAKAFTQDAEASTGNGGASPESGDASTERGEASTERGEASTEGGEASTEGGEASTEGGDASTEGADASTDRSEASTEGADASTKGADASTEVAEASTEGAEEC